MCCMSSIMNVSNNGVLLLPWTGMAGCPCINASGVLESLVSRSCIISDGQNGVRLTVEGPCVPHSYGFGCGRHDLLHDPKCALAGPGESSTPDYCLRSWCYVDASTCKQSTSDRLYRSYYFPPDKGIDLFYSYSTCESTADDWMSYVKQMKQQPLGGISISAAIPLYSVPLMFKRNPAGDILESPGIDYYNSSVPFEGAFISYLDKLEGIAEGDFTINYTYASTPGQAAHGGEKWMGAVQDVEDGLVDVAVGQFWITAERLEKVSFTVPLFSEKIVLFIPDPGEDSHMASAYKVLAPFTTGLWGVAVAIITATALLSVWFSKKRFHQVKQPGRLKKKYYARLAVDELLKKGTFFCSAGVEQDPGATLPEKLLMFGFSFFILILVSSFVANLAAFLTRPIDFVGTMEEVVKRGYRVCASPILRTSLEIMWPTANFVFVNGPASKRIDEHKAGRCQVIAAGKFDTTHSAKMTKAFCDAKFVFTDSLVMENPVAFPIRPELAAGLSYWIYRGEKEHGITLEAVEKEYDKKIKWEPLCELEYSVQEHEADELEKIGPKHFFFPIMVFLGFAVLAVILELYHEKELRKGVVATSLGRPSTFDDHKRDVGSRRSKEDSLSKDHSGTLFQRFRTMVTEQDSFRDTHHGACADLEPQSVDAATISANNVITSDVIQQEGSFNSPDDNSNLQIVKKGLRILNSEDNTTECANGGGTTLPNSDDSTTSELYRVIDKFFHCVDEIKKQKES